MAGVYCCTRPSLLLFQPHKLNDFRCCWGPPKHVKKKKKDTPQLLKLAVTGLTELLRLFSSTSNRVDIASDGQSDELSVSGIDDILEILKSDYENAYFVTGIFTSSIYVKDCIFEDPTIKFSGKELYSRNLKLLVPFFDQPSVLLQKLEKSNDPEIKFVLASWKLRTYLKLPWRPLISIDGKTVYQLDDKYMIFRHTESWNVSAFEAISQIFTPSSGRTGS